MPNLKNMKRIIFGAALMLITSNVTFSQENFNCFTVIAGKNATIDGSVMMAHNEDDGGDQFLNLYKVPAQKYSQGDFYELKRGAKEPQPAQTNGYIWIELPGMEVSDCFLNDKGVAVASDNCPSREDREDYTDGGILYGIRRLVTERASTAKEAVEIIGGLVEKYGYHDSGRSYCVADKNEAWMVSLVRGRRWVAARIPDDQVVILPNYYVINKVDLSDSVNYLGSKDIIDYAIERGWYSPKTDGEFNFAKVYSNPGSYSHLDNINREWMALCQLSEKEYDRANYEAFPFSFVPAKKVTIEKLISVMSNHYEGTDIDARAKSDVGNPHTKGGTICVGATQFCAIYHLRGNMPTSVGAMMWFAPYRPCTQLFVPYYVGMDKTPEVFSRYKSYKEAQDKHFTDVKDFRASCSKHAYWDCVDLAATTDSNYKQSIIPLQKSKSKIQHKLIQQQPKIEKTAIKLLETDHAKGIEFLTDYTEEIFD